MSHAPESGSLTVYLVRAQSAAPDAPYGPVRTLGDPYTDRDKAKGRRDRWIAADPSYRHAYIEAEVIELPEPPNPCPYTHAHTSYWCGYPQCRES